MHGVLVLSDHVHTHLRAHRCMIPEPPDTDEALDGFSMTPKLLVAFRTSRVFCSERTRSTVKTEPKCEQHEQKSSVCMRGNVEGANLA